jgi:hypothetical protein
MISFHKNTEVPQDSPMLRHLREVKGGKTYNNETIDAAVSLNKLLPDGGDSQISPLIGKILGCHDNAWGLQGSFSAAQNIILAHQKSGLKNLEGTVQTLMQLCNEKSINAVHMFGGLCTLSPVSSDDLQILLNVAQNNPETLAPIYKIQRAITECHENAQPKSKKSEYGDIDNKYMQAVKIGVSALTGPTLNDAVQWLVGKNFTSSELSDVPALFLLSRLDNVKDDAMSSLIDLARDRTERKADQGLFLARALFVIGTQLKNLELTFDTSIVEPIQQLPYEGIDDLLSIACEYGSQQDPKAASLEDFQSFFSKLVEINNLSGRLPPYFDDALINFTRARRHFEGPPISIADLDNIIAAQEVVESGQRYEILKTLYKDIRAFKGDSTNNKHLVPDQIKQVIELAKFYSSHYQDDDSRKIAFQELVGTLKEYVEKRDTFIDSQEARTLIGACSRSCDLEKILSFSTKLARARNIRHFEPEVAKALGTLIAAANDRISSDDKFWNCKMPQDQAQLSNELNELARIRGSDKGAEAFARIPEIMSLNGQAQLTLGGLNAILLELLTFAATNKMSVKDVEIKSDSAE